MAMIRAFVVCDFPALILTPFSFARITIAFAIAVSDMPGSAAGAAAASYKTLG